MLYNPSPAERAAIQTHQPALDNLLSVRANDYLSVTTATLAATAFGVLCHVVHTENHFTSYQLRDHIAPGSNEKLRRTMGNALARLATAGHLDMTSGWGRTPSRFLLKPSLANFCDSYNSLYAEAMGLIGLKLPDPQIISPPATMDSTARARLVVARNRHLSTAVTAVHGTSWWVESQIDRLVKLRRAQKTRR